MIAKSSLSPDEQRDFINVLSRADDVDLQPIADLCIEDMEWVQKLYSNYKAKQSAHAARDTQSWEEILKNEEQLLKGIEK